MGRPKRIFTETHAECVKCKVTKIHNEFSKHKTSKFGYLPRCKMCRSEDDKLYISQHKRPQLTSDQFWAKVAKTADENCCWLWLGAKYPTGYGKTSNQKSAHRTAYTFAKGRIPKGLYVLHSCDVPLCCNPHHLRVGTHEDNMRDMAEKLRARSGGAKLSEDDVRDIRRLSAEGIDVKIIAAKYDMCDKHITAIVEKRRWAYVV